MVAHSHADIGMGPDKVGDGRDSGSDKGKGPIPFSSGDSLRKIPVEVYSVLGGSDREIVLSKFVISLPDKDYKKGLLYLRRPS